MSPVLLQLPVRTCRSWYCFSWAKTGSKTFPESGSCSYNRMNNINKSNACTTSKKRNRRKLGSRNYKNYSAEMLDIAVDLVKRKVISSRQAEKQFGIPRRTILNKAKEAHMKPVGGPKKLTDIEEDKLVNVLVAAGEYGCPMTKLDLKMLVFNYLEKNSRSDIFNGKLPGKTWVEQFLNRHSSKLSVRTTQNIKQVRAEKGLQEIQNFFDNLQETLKDVPPSNILNYDETNLSDNPGNSKCIFRRGIKYPERILNSSKSCVSIMFTVSAAGECLPTYVVYKAINLYSEWVSGGPDGTRYNCTKSGWFDSACFEDYFKTIILQWAKNLPGPKVIIGDNLSSHLNIEVVELCQRYNMRFVFLPPNSTHLTQPLDVAYFAPLKREWRKILLHYKNTNPGQSTINKKHFPKLLAELLKNINLRESSNIISGFRAVGIWPINARNVLKRLPEYFEEGTYEIDSALLDYLQKTRSPKPMAVKRSKKLRTEPGKSVCAADILAKTNNKKNTQNKKRIEDLENQQVDFNDMETMVQDSEINILQQGAPIDRYITEYDNIQEENEIYILDDKLGDFVKNTPKEYEGRVFPSNNSNKMLSTANDEILQSPHIISPVLNNPASLSTICTTVINNNMTSSIQHPNPLSPDYVHILSRNVKRDNQNLPFIIKNNNDLPSCLKSTNQPKVIITSDVKLDCKQRKTNKNVKIQIGDGAKVIRESALTMEIFKKDNNVASAQTDENNKFINNIQKKKNTKKQKTMTKDSRVKCEKKGKITKYKTKSRKKSVVTVKKYFSESSSEISDTLMSTAETDDSEYETLNDYITTCLRDQSEKENLEPDIPIGISDIEYFTGNVDTLKEGYWVIAKFATKKSVKHFVGRILSVTRNIPTVKFVRKVKNTSGGKKLTFTYPPVEDICEMHHVDDVVVVLPQPIITRRGQVMFEVDFSSYNIQ